MFSAPKTQSDVWVLTIGQITIHKLHEHQHKQNLEKEAAGKQWHEQDLISPSVIGTLMDLHNLLREFKAMLEKAGLPIMRFYDLHHTSITLMLNENGAPAKKAQRWAGHASPDTTINIYGGEVTMKLDEIVAQELGELIMPV